MAAVAHCPYRPTLRALTQAGVPFCLMGTYALRAQLPALAAAYPLTDCDLLLPADAALLARVAGLLQAEGWTLTLWDEPLPQSLTAAALAGKYYLRARRGAAVLDLTYELDDFTYADFAARCRWLSGLPLVEPAFLLQQKARRNRPTDRQVLRLCGWEPAAGPEQGRGGPAAADAGPAR